MAWTFAGPRLAALGLAVALAVGCAAPVGEVVAGESAVRGASAGAVATRPNPPPTGATATGVDDAKLLGVPARESAGQRVGEAVQVGGLSVVVTEARAGEGRVAAGFAIENRGAAATVVSPGNFRLRTDGARPRMRLRENAPTNLPVGTLQPGQSLRGEVTWDLPDGAALAVLFVNGDDSAAWMLSQ
jgi:sarcosine oxidase gamma subunit